MGHTAETKCLDCGYEFTDDYGGGFSFYQVRCDLCGRPKVVGFEQLGDLQTRFHSDTDPITEEEYHQGINEFAGKCKCGGQFTLQAEPRCPKCRSTNLEEGEDGPMVYYD